MKNQFQFNSFAQMIRVLHDDESCRLYLENLRWEGKPVCPHCAVIDECHYKLKAKGVFKGLYKCKSCKERFTVTVGTIFEGSKIPLQKWFIAMYIFSSHKKGISSHQLAKDLGITQKSAWFMLGRMRTAFKLKTMVLFEGQVQTDETFVGGKNKNRHKDKKVEKSQGRSFKDKTPVFGMLNSEGKIYTQVIPDTKAKTIKPIVNSLIAKGSILITDEWSAYTGLSKNYNHVVVNHSRHQYANEGLSTNGVENFWSHLKRGLYGVYHQVSPKHLHLYCDEFTYRFNSRKVPCSERFADSLLCTENSRIRYKELIAGLKPKNP